MLIMSFGMERDKQKGTKGTFLVPSYYKNFHCKGTECRNTCCHGWTVTISSKEYFLLHGLNVNKKLRETIDRSFLMVANPTKERYAEIRHNYDGDCPLLLENGYCSLHQTLGEKVLPAVCRYYPRGPRSYFGFECSCSNSCEKTLELLFEDLNPLSFEEINLSFDMPLDERKANEENTSQYLKIKKLVFDLLIDRKYTLPERLKKIGTILDTLDNVIPVRENDKNKSIDDVMDLMMEISRWFATSSPSLSEHFIEILKEYELVEDKYLLYTSKRKRFENELVNHEIYYEKMLMNNLFFRRFPFQEYTKDFHEEYVALTGKYVLIRFIGIHLWKGQNIEEFIDLMSRSFRVIAHTRFEKTIISLLKMNDFESSVSLNIALDL